jgi:hypothetical protein
MSKNGSGYLTPLEALDRYPQLSSIHGMSEHTLGLLLKHHVLWGMYDSGKRMPLIQEDSLLYFIDYLNTALEKQRIIKK